MCACKVRDHMRREVYERNEIVTLRKRHKVHQVRGFCTPEVPNPNKSPFKHILGPPNILKTVSLRSI